MRRFDGKPILAESSYGVMGSWLAFASVVVRPDTGNQQRRKDDINDNGLHEDPAELGFFLSRDPRNRCNDAKTSVFWSLDAGLG